MGSTESKNEKQAKEEKHREGAKQPKKKQVSPKSISSLESDSVSYSSETNASSSGRSTTNSDISHYPDSPGYYTKQPQKYTEYEDQGNYGNHHGCCLKCECYCDCGRDCTDNCCCRCLKDSCCCLMGFIWTILKYFLLFCIYFLVTCVIICCPPLWILLFCSSGSRGILRCAIWRNLLGLAGE